MRRTGNVIAQRHGRIEENCARVANASTQRERITTPDFEVFGRGQIAQRARLID
jgi:hypothetical protein